MANEYNPEYRYIFPSYDWDDVWIVNQIINLPEIVGAKNIGFLKGVPNEEIKKNNDLIRKWIDENMEKCSCLILFVGEKTYQSYWVKYEIELARKLEKGRFIINLEGMKRQDNSICKKGQDPYSYHGLYTNNAVKAYMIKQYSWINDDGISYISNWIEDAIDRAK